LADKKKLRRYGGGATGTHGASFRAVSRMRRSATRGAALVRDQMTAEVVLGLKRTAKAAPGK
jgi:hypothetical protein